MFLVKWQQKIMQKARYIKISKDREKALKVVRYSLNKSFLTLFID